MTPRLHRKPIGSLLRPRQLRARPQRRGHLPRSPPRVAQGDEPPPTAAAVIPEAASAVRARPEARGPACISTQEGPSPLPHSQREGRERGGAGLGRIRCKAVCASPARRRRIGASSLRGNLPGRCLPPLAGGATRHRRRRSHHHHHPSSPTPPFSPDEGGRHPPTHTPGASLSRSLSLSLSLSLG